MPATRAAATTINHAIQVYYHALRLAMALLLHADGAQCRG